MIDWLIEEVLLGTSLLSLSLYESTVFTGYWMCIFVSRNSRSYFRGSSSQPESESARMYSNRCCHVRALSWQWWIDWDCHWWKTYRHTEDRTLPLLAIDNRILFIRLLAIMIRLSCPLFSCRSVGLFVDDRPFWKYICDYGVTNNVCVCDLPSSQTVHAHLLFIECSSLMWLATLSFASLPLIPSGRLRFPVCHLCLSSRLCQCYTQLSANQTL